MIKNSGNVGGAAKIQNYLTLDLSKIMKGMDKTQETNIFYYRFSNSKDLITFELQINGFDRILNVCHCENETGKETESTIYFTFQSSNMISGGYVWFFICPKSHVTCRKLLFCFESKTFKHRDSFSNKVYYPSQYLTPNHRKPYRIQLIETNLGEIKETHKTDYYNDRKTRGALKIEKMENQLLLYAVENYLHCFNPISM